MGVEVAERVAGVDDGVGVLIAVDVLSVVGVGVRSAGVNVRSALVGVDVLSVV